MSAGRWFGGCVILYLCLATGSALTKRPWGDEAWTANPAVDLLVRGKMGITVAEPTGNSMAPGKVLLRLNESVYTGMPLGYVAQAGWYRIVGFGIFRMRALSMLCGLLALASCWIIVKELTANDNLALLAAFFLTIDRAFIDAASDGRPDMMSAALGYASLAAYLRLRERRFAAAVLVSQCFLATSILTHPIGGVAVFGILYLALDLDRHRIRARHLLLAALPYAAAGAAWGLYILRDPEAFRSQFSSNASGRMGGLLSPWTGFWREITVRFLDGYYLPSFAAGVRRLTVLIPIAYAVGLLSLAFVRERRRLLMLVLLYFAVISVFEGNKNYYYLAHIVPMLAISFAAAVHWYWTRRMAPRWAVALFCGGFLALQLGWAAYSMRQNHYRNIYQAAVAVLRQHAGPQMLVDGPAEFGFVLGFHHNFIDDAALGFFTGRKADVIITDERTYRQAFKVFPTTAPAVHQHVSRLLAEVYRKIYDGPFYEIYIRR